MAEQQHKLEILNSHFTVDSYDGGSQQDTTNLEVENILKKGEFHCSKKGTNFNLVLSSDTKFTLTHFVVYKAPHCTCPIKSGLLHVFEEKPTEEQIKAFENATVDANKEGESPHYEFLLPENKDYVEVELNNWRSGKYLYVKFVDCYALYGGEKNIDVGFVGFVGYAGDKVVPKTQGPIPDELNITPKKLSLWNQLSPDFIDDIQSGTCCIVFERAKNYEVSKKALEELAKSGEFKKDFVFFYAENEEALSERLARKLGLNEDTAISVFNLEENKTYTHTGECNAESLKTFLQSVKEGKATLYLKSQPRPKDDLDPDHPEIVRLTANSFKELVIDSDKEYLVDVWASWCGPCVAIAPTISLLAKTLSDVPQIKIAKLDCDANQVDRKYFPEPTIPNIKFFSNKDKQNAIPHSGSRNVESFLKFIHENANTKFDLQTYIDKAKQLELEAKKKALKNVIFVQSHEDYEKHIAKAKEDKKLVVVDFFAEWCGPCKYIAPLYATLSETHSDVVFLKVDVDELSETSQKEEITAMPTFLFYKNGEKIDSFSGADEEELEKHIVKHK